MADKIVYTGNVWDEAKAHLLAIIVGYGRQAKLTLKDPKWYQEFYNRMRHITDSIVKLQPDLYEQAKNSNLKNKALMVAFDYLTEQDIEVESLVIDGIVIYKDNVPPERISWVLAVCSQRVKEVK
ncbi:Hypothetical predicted protein [Mytilus galloprovincialis]|uniref:Uncharacterized protein n=1 Tax=Mytilus galloprovincialis TaxID=29158 RepID=A0A8B6BDI2_MYTGA|nr:Hypothetical predicted protein [Mytilus galloprovincialis]